MTIKNNNINNTNLVFNKLDLDLIKYYSNNFAGVKKAIKFMAEFKSKINHLLSSDPSDLSIFDFNYDINYIDFTKGTERFIPDKNIPEFELILNNLYLKYSIDNEFFDVLRGFNEDHLFLKGFFDKFYYYEVKPGTFIYDLIDLDFKTPEKKKQFLFSMLISCIKQFNLHQDVTVDYIEFISYLGKKIAEHCLEIFVKNLKQIKINYVLAIFDFYECNAEEKINLFKKFINFKTDNIKLINFLNNYIIYNCLEFEDNIFLKKFEQKINLIELKKKLSTNIIEGFISIGKKILDSLISDNCFILNNIKLSTKLLILNPVLNECEIFDYNFPKVSTKNKGLKKYKIHKDKLFKYLKSLDLSRIKLDINKFDKVFDTNFKEIEKVFKRQGEDKNFIKLFRYSCDFYCSDRFQYDELVSARFYFFHLEELEKLCRQFYIRKLVFNIILFRCFILLHFSHFLVKKKNEFYLDKDFYQKLEKK